MKNDKSSLFKGIETSRTFKNICNLLNLKERTVLNIGCGYGQYLKNFGKGSLGITTALEEVEFGKRNSLTIEFGNAEFLDESLRGRKFEAFWANNLFEHLLSPHSFLMKLKKSSSPDSVLILGVPVIPKIVSLVRLNKFRGMLASNHINFFTVDTLKLTVERAGWKVKEVRTFIFKSRFLDRIIRPFSPHLYVVAENNQDFKYPSKKIGEWKDDKRYSELLSVTNQND